MHRKTSQVSNLAARRQRGSQRVVAGARGGGRMWINGREVGGPSERFPHLRGAPG